MSGADKSVCGSCAICGRWPSALRSVMRSAINVLLLKEPICAECFQAFWTTLTGLLSGLVFRETPQD